MPYKIFAKAETTSSRFGGFDTIPIIIGTTQPSLNSTFYYLITSSSNLLIHFIMLTEPAAPSWEKHTTSNQISLNL